MDPFLAIFCDVLRIEQSVDQALTEVRLLLDDPATQQLFHDLASREAGREILAEWQQDWHKLGVTPPWLGLVGTAVPAAAAEPISMDARLRMQLAYQF